MSSKLIAERAARAQLLALSGLPQGDIAKSLDCTTRTIRRYLQFELPVEQVAELSAIDVSLHEKFIEKAWSLIPRLIDYIEIRLESGELSGRDAIVATGVLVDKVRALTPMQPRVTQMEEVKFVFSVEGKSTDALEDPDKESEDIVEDTDVE